MFAFKKTQRLLTKNDYNYVFEQAKKIVTSEFIILFRENNLGYARLGLALSKKMIAKAHDRNRIKRLLRESFRQKELPAVDLVFLARQGVAKQTNAIINARMGKTWKKIISCYEK
ncbi:MULTISPECIES: ribonuclease P protein component [Legionella]|uniref:Ribonuclease P protein component n=1 Tax=Legionella resiliens TaxID=2905958 RepID=A0ABS8X2U0_9GAMM|nr:ribonuclease P protein component [Legionella sp. PC1000]MCE0722070.1 ribonuclease P protein component [Legionella sp. 9fVS26]MCE3531224.1 ribonuclease P protein component [Legionella sp. 8cVS16]QLZ70812.1 ribonuclease P protein component [Legionella sp. PC1000]